MNRIALGLKEIIQFYLRSALAIKNLLPAASLLVPLQEFKRSHFLFEVCCDVPPSQLA